ncbi:MAG: hypothetical protein AAF394_00155 [Planctomycetota bacterium]
MGEVAWVVEPSMLEMMDKSPEHLREKGWSEELIEQSRFENCYGYFEGAELQFHFSEMDREPLMQLQVEVEGEGDPLPAIRSLCKECDWEVAQLNSEMEWELVPLETARVSSQDAVGAAGLDAAELEQLLIHQISCELQDSWQAFSGIPPRHLVELLGALDLNGPIAIENALRIAEQLLGEEGSSLAIELALAEDFPRICFPALCRCLAACCGVEGFSIAAAVLEQGTSSELPAMAKHLLCFGQNDAFLNWLEFYFQERQQNISSEWGKLVRTSNVEPSRLRQWLQAGTSLATIAMDAIIADIESDESEKRIWTSLASQDLQAILEAVLQCDDSPMLEKRAQRLVEHLNEGNA